MTARDRPIRWLRNGAIIALALLGALALLAVSVGHRYFSGGGYHPTPWVLRADTLEGDIQGALDREMALNPQAHGMLLHISAPRLGIDRSFAAGSAGDEPLRPEHLVRIASNTKTYTAVAVLVLIERGAFTLNTPVRDLLSEDTTALLARDGYDTAAIEVRHLLSHTAGMPDYGEHPAYMFSNLWGDIVRRPPHWTRASQIEFAMRHTSPLGGPGETYAYSDTGYILLGEIIERATGKPLPAAVRDLCRFDDLQLAATWWEQLETPRVGSARAHQYMGAADTYDMDPSIDLYGGGGLIASIADLAHFTRVAVRGDLFEQPETLSAMLTPVTPNRPNYALGVYAIDIDGERCWGHVGFWGTIAFHCPRSDITVARSFSQANTPDLDQRLIDVVRALEATTDQTREGSPHDE